MRDRLAGLVGRSSGWAAAAASLLSGAIVWEVAGRLFAIDFLPPLSSVLSRLVDLVINGNLIGQLGDSLLNLVLGVAISIVVGIGLGIAMGSYPRLYGALDPYVTALNSTPVLIFAPILFNFFGLSRWSIVALIAISMSVYLTINTAAALRGVSRSLLDMGRSFNASDRQLFSFISLPAALPFILATTRLAAGRGVKAMINGEIFIGVVGLGGVVTRAGAQFDATTVLAVMFVIAAVGFGLLGIVAALEARFTSWLPAIDARTPAGPR